MFQKFKHRKTTVFASVVVCGVVAVTMMSSRKDGDRGYAPLANDPSWEQAPPKADKVTVQQLSTPLATGENMRLEISYQNGAVKGTSVAMFIDERTQVVLNDDGLNGDEKANDGTFSSFVREDLQGFVTAMDDFDRTLVSNKNNLMVFTGRTGSNVIRQRPFFDKAAFAGFAKVDISREIFSLPPVSPSGTITALMQGFNGTGYNGGVITNPGGVAIARTTAGNGPPPPPPTIFKERSLLITALSVVEDPVRTFNPCTGVGNPNGAWTFKTLMKGMANQTFTGITAKEFTKHLVRRWTVDTTINGELVRNRASRAITFFIKPWIDKARGTTLPTVTLANWQSLWDGISQDNLLNNAPMKLTAIVNRLDLRGNFGYGGSANNSGETRFIYSVIRNSTVGGACRDSISNSGFDGFNIIAEYGNKQTSCAAVKAYALQWANLSTMVLGSAAYNAALEVITHNVTDSNAVPSKPNRSALNQLRTNEIALTNSANSAPDRSPRWQFREFKIQASNKRLEEVPITLEPATKFNGAELGPPATLLADVTVMSTWVNANSVAIKNNTAVVPLLIGLTNFQGAKANYPSASPTLAPGFWDGRAGAVITDDTTREVFSLNTCTGCHSMEPKTVFTHVNYVGIGTSMNYWTTLNAVTNGNQHKTHISPFLTGVDIIPTTLAGPPFILGDDSTSVAENLTDNTLTGFFWARDPAGRNYPGTGIVRKWGFNDLQRRSQDLTNLLNSTCFPIISVSAAQIAFFQPLNMSH